MPEVRHLINVGQPEIDAFRQLVARYEIGEVDYLNNDLSTDPEIDLLKTEYRSFLKLVLRSQQRQYGTLYLLKEISQGFDKEHFDVLHTFISQTLVTIDNFRLISESIQNEQYKKELTIAARIQDSLLPRVLPGNIPLDMSIFSLPAKEVGGDFYDFYEISDDRLAIIIGDVSGKGISAAFYMAQVKGIFQALMQLEKLLPDQFMIMANKALSKSLERSSFITASVYYIDYNMKGLSFARAGHCHTLYHNRGTDQTFYFQTEGLGLGIVRDDRYAQKIKRLHYDYNPGDVMVLYTDGITEARDESGEEYGTDRMLELLSENHQLSAEQIKNILIEDMQKFCGNASPHDDQTLVVLKFA